MLLQGDLDLAYIDGEKNSGLQKVLISSEPAYVLVSRDSALARAENVTLEDLARQPILIPRICAMPEESKRLLGTYLGREPGSGSSTASLTREWSMSGSTRGLCLQPAPTVCPVIWTAWSPFPFPNPDLSVSPLSGLSKGLAPAIPVQAFIKEHQQELL